MKRKLPLLFCLLFLTGCAMRPTETATETVTPVTPAPSTPPAIETEEAEMTLPETMLPETITPPPEDTAMTVPDYNTYFSISEITDDIFKRMQGKSYPKGCPLSLDTLRYVTVAYVNFDGEVCQGELVVNAKIAEDVISIFKELFEEEYPIEKISLIDEYDADDDQSMAANNSSAFCYRVISGTDRLSNHSFGLAIDINPLYNPYIKSNGKVLPEEAEAFADRSLSNPYYISSEDSCVRIFKKYGFTWGGDWKNSKDYQHFERES